MKITILIILIQSLLLGESNVTKLYYDDNHIMFMKTRQDNNITEHKEYYYSGVLKAISHTKDAHVIGVSKHYYPNGQISAKLHYDSNNKETIVTYPPNITEYFKVALEGGARGYAMREDLNTTKESLFNTAYEKIEDNYYLRIYNHLGYMVKETLYKNGKVFGEMKVFEHNENLPVGFNQCGG